MKKKAQEMYDNERMDQILKEFQEALVIADNFSEPVSTKEALKEYKKIWTLFRGTGANLLGLTYFLLNKPEDMK
mgnify:CR=1 FL=1